MTTTDAEVRIEPATLSDVDALVDCWVELARGQRAYDSHLAAEENRTPVREALAQHVVTDGVRVARDDGVVGFVMFSIESGDYEQTLTRGVVHNLFVAPEARRQGIGSALLAAAEEALTAAGADVVSLEAMATNDGARRFYERHGYHTHRVELEKPTRSDTHSKEDG
ncbi:GNAT family N-acetyltransferase [Salinigranum sp. GCM10025319]|uniref:GNAT family N-acetyltransferase n=1 Tax=Salinigranum sp. GCM10025319 TaxID=3252687 RepID=UPI003612C4E3